MSSWFHHIFSIETTMLRFLSKRRWKYVIICFLENVASRIEQSYAVYFSKEMSRNVMLVASFQTDKLISKSRSICKQYIKLSTSDY